MPAHVLSLLSSRALLSPDPDVRRLFWLVRRASIRPEHRVALAPLHERFRSRVRARFEVSERELIRVLFNLYSGRTVRVQD